MKPKNELFSEKMPSDLRSKILANAEIELTHVRQKNRRSFFNLIFSAGLAAAAASFAFFFVRQNHSESSHLEVAQSMDLLEEFKNDEDFELLAEFELIESLELIDQIEEET